MTAAQPLACERFTFYGCAVDVRSASAELLEEVRRDFASFQDVEPRESPALARVLSLIHI